MVNGDRLLDIRYSVFVIGYWALRNREWLLVIGNGMRTEEVAGRIIEGGKR